MRAGADTRGVMLFGEDTWGAKVEGVELGFSAFGLEVADAAALGLKALGLRTSEAAALGLVEFGPDTVGAEPGVGDDTPPEICASAAPLNARLAASARKACRTGPELAMASSRRNCRPHVNVRWPSRLPGRSGPAQAGDHIHASFSPPGPRVGQRPTQESP